MPVDLDQSRVNCSICGYVMDATGRTFYDDRYGYPGTFSTFGCRHCGHISLHADFTPKQLTDLYSNYYPRSALDVENHTPPKECEGFGAWFDGIRCKAFRWVPPGVRVLDIGCGFGETLGYHQARGCEVHGVEADQNILRVAEKFGYNVHVGLFDPELYAPGYFDYVTLDQVIEHVTDPVATLRGIERVLKPGGVAILSTPDASGWGARLFGRYWINWHTPYHLQLFSLRSMKAAAERAGLVLESSRTITSSEWLYYQWIHLLSFPNKGVPSQFWAHLNHMSFPQKIGMHMLAWMHRTRLNHLVTRIFDALDVGDCRLYFLRKP
jgi:2-polyprenyl-3-methyl-5-hydroxy-6-metoxy-1,4-benzoquinol methylase